MRNSTQKPIRQNNFSNSEPTADMCMGKMCIFCPILCPKCFDINKGRRAWKKVQSVISSLSKKWKETQNQLPGTFCVIWLVCLFVWSHCVAVLCFTCCFELQKCELSRIKKKKTFRHMQRVPKIVQTEINALWSPFNSNLLDCHM